MKHSIAAQWPFPVGGFDTTTDEQVLADFKRVNHIRIVHLFNKKDARGGVTIAYMPTLQDADGNPQGKFAYVSVSYCRTNEMYNRKLGEKLVLINQYNEHAILLPIYQDGHPVRELKYIFDGFY